MKIYQKDKHNVNEYKSFKISCIYNTTQLHFIEASNKCFETFFDYFRPSYYETYFLKSYECFKKKNTLNFNQIKSFL